MATSNKVSNNKLNKLWVRLGVAGSIIIVWLALAGIGGPYFGKIEEVSSTDLTTFLPENAEATKVNERLADFQDQGVIPAIVVFEKKSGAITSEENVSIEQATGALEKVPGVTQDVSPALVSDDGQASYVLLPLKSDSDLDEVFAAIDQSLAAQNLSVEYTLTGPAGFSRDLTKAFKGIDGILLLVALAVVFIILLIVYRSPVLPLAVLTVSLCALAVSILIVWNLAKAGIVDLNGQVQGILFILVIGATTDYSLLYISRYREELQKYTSTTRATFSALKSSVEPILASGGTVIVGLLCLLFSDLSSNKALGPVGSIGIGLAIISSLTFLPAILMLFGRGAFWPRRPMHDPKQKTSAEKQHPTWARFAKLIQKKPRLLWVGSSLILLVAAYGGTMIKADGVPQSDLILGYSEAREGQKILNKHFPAGSGSPANVIVTVDKVDELVAVIDNERGVDGVSATAVNSESGRVPLGSSAEKIKSEIRVEVEKELVVAKQDIKTKIDAATAGAPPEIAEAAYQSAIANIPTVETVVNDAYPFKDASIKTAKGDALLQVTLSDSPDSDAAKETIIRLREVVRTVDKNSIVGGVTAVQYDTNEASIHDRMVIIPLILLAITLILIALLRSIVVPILLLGTTVLSFFATLGVAALLFNNVWHFPGADPSVVLYGFVFLVALGIDYNIFLMTRVREESLKLGTQKGVIKGLIVTGGVITSAGIVLAATFAALAVIPILFLAQLAFIVAFGVLLDTIIIRSIVVPALILDIGSKAWWPSKLMRKK